MREQGPTESRQRPDPARRGIIGRVNQDWRQQLCALLDEEGLAGHGKEDIDRVLREKGGPYAALIHLIAHVDFDEAEAKRQWKAIRRHHKTLTRLLGRDPDRSVAALDYFHNILRLYTAPKIIEQRAYKTAERYVMTDALTGLFNRQFFRDTLKREARRVQRYGKVFSLALLDLDDFRRVNENHGESVGNQALVHLSEIMRQNLRRTDLPCRHSGEAFAVILPDTGRVGAYMLTERIRADVERRFRGRLFGDRVLGLTVSGGIAAFPDDAGSPEELILHADRALHYSKRQGKNRVLLHV